MMNELHQECHVACFSETTNASIFHYSLTGVKDKLLEDWMENLSPIFQRTYQIESGLTPRGLERKQSANWDDDTQISKGC